MTQTIHHGTRRHSLEPLDEAVRHRPCIVTVARWFFGLMGLMTLATLLPAFTLDSWRWALAASTFAILALFGGLVIAIDMLMADRREFYQRGQLDGWYRGYRMQSPEIDDPLLH